MAAKSTCGQLGSLRIFCKYCILKFISDGLSVKTDI